MIALFANEGRAEVGLHSIASLAAMRLSSGALSFSAEAVRFEFAVSKLFSAKWMLSSNS